MAQNQPFHFSSVVLLLLFWAFAIADAGSIRPTRGIKIIPGTCQGKDLLKAEYAIIDASRLTSAGYFAAKTFNNTPFNMFFDPTPQNSFHVGTVYQRIMHSQQGRGSLIGVTCQDTYNRCNYSMSENTTMPAYSAQFSSQHRALQIVLCSKGLALPRDPEPCSADPGRISLGWLMVHEMTGLSVISGSKLNISDLKIGTAREVMEKVLTGQETTEDADAYGYLGIWSWALGLGGPLWSRRRQCLGNARRGNPDAALWHIPNKS